MTHKDAILSILRDAGVTKAELARRCQYLSGTPAIDPRLRSDLKLSTLRNLVEALGYEVALIPQQPGQPVYVLDEDVPVEQRCGNNPGGRKGARKKSAKIKKAQSWTSEELFKKFGMEEV